MSTLEERIDDYLVRQVEKYLELRTALEAQAAEWTAKANQFAESGGDFGGAYHLRQAAANITKLLEGNPNEQRMTKRLGCLSPPSKAADDLEP